MTMKSLSRSEFIKTGSLGVAATVLATKTWGNHFYQVKGTDNELFVRLLRNNDESVSAYLNQNSERNNTNPVRTRSSTTEFAVLASSYCTSGSEYYKSVEVSKRLEKIIENLLELQQANGTLNSGGNIGSPPDTAFLLESLCPAATVLFKDETEEIKLLNGKLKEFLLKTGEALVSGGIHTPNHRWVVSAGLARLYALFGDERYVKRIDQWLAEGIYIDSDGQFPERSRNYAVVVDRSLITIAYILNRPELYVKVEKNLLSTYYFMEENGELITVDSRRQDQNFLLSIAGYYLEYRFIAIYNNNDFLAAVTRKIEALEEFEKRVLGLSLVYFLERPVLLEELPGEKELPTNYTQYFPITQAARIKRGKVTATIFGGNDRPIIIASGRSTNPTFFTFRKGDAILDYCRISTSFFNTGYFRADGLVKDGNTFRLHEKKEGYYFQPMPTDKINPNGEYKFSESTDKRFWSKMDFDSRQLSNVQTLETDIAIRENEGEFTLEISIKGTEQIDVVFELCFRKGGEFTHVVPAGNDDDYFLEEEYVTYKSGNDTIKIGPGKTEHKRISRLDGEMYSTHFGSIKGDGMHLYLTGATPFRHTLKISYLTGY